MKVIELVAMELDGIEQLAEEKTELTERLEDWMKWCCGKHMPRLWYPAAVPYARLMLKHSEERRVPQVTIDPFRAMDTERAVNQLPDRLKHIIRVHYRYKHLRNSYIQLSVLKTAGIGIQKRRYYQLVSDAHTMLKNILTRLHK